MRATHPSKILIIDDHPLVNHGLAEIIKHEENLAVCGRATTAAEGRRIFEATDPDLVILDILLPDGHGLELLTDFRRIDASAKVVVFSSADPEIYADKARELGAAGFVHKSMVLEEIVPAIREALGETVR